MKKFKAKLTSRGPAGAWTFLEIPFNVEEAFGMDRECKKEETRLSRAEKATAMILAKKHVR